MSNLSTLFWSSKKKSTLDYGLLDEDLLTYDTGDIILFSGVSWLDRAIRLCSGSKYSHVGIVLRDPVNIDPKLTGLYFIESTLNIVPDAEDGKPKFGVTLHKLDQVLAEHAKAGDKAVLRKIRGFGSANSTRIPAAYDAVKFIPYDITLTDWIRAKEVADEKSIEEFISTHRVPAKDLQEISSLWCSAFVGFFYVQLGILEPSTAWALLAPKHFSQQDEDLSFLPGYSLREERTI